jgi:hypothetical protein
MAKKRKSSKKRSKPAKPAKAKARSGPINIGSGNAGKKGRELPKPRVTAAQVKVLEVQVQSLVQQMRLLTREQQTLNQRLEQEWQEREQRTAMPAPPSPPDAMFAAFTESIAETLERTRRIEACVQQPPRDPSLDVPASVASLRRMFAGACKTLNLTRPTPAIVGRVMHYEGAFNRGAAKSPYVLFNSIYNAVTTELRLRPMQGESTDNANVDYVHLNDEMVELMQGRSSRPPDKHATYYDSQLKPRIRLLEHMRLACIEENRTGQRLDYSRYLTPSGRELFDGWPEWTDATGGIGLADEQTELPTSQPERAGPDDGATQSAT